MSVLCLIIFNLYRGADKSLARPGRKQARKHVRDARDFNNIETRAVIKFFFHARQGAEGNSRHSDRTLACFLTGRAKDLSAPPYNELPTLCFSTFARIRFGVIHIQAMCTSAVLHSRVACVT